MKKLYVSVHLQDFPKLDSSLIDVELEKQIEISQKITSLILRIRKLEGVKVRQPLSKAIIPALNDEFAVNLAKVEELIKSEVNIKNIEIIDRKSSVIKRSAKPNFKALGAKVGKDMKAVTGPIFAMTNEQIQDIENGNTLAIEANGNSYVIGKEDIEIVTADIPGWQIMNDGIYTVALDLEITDTLKLEGVARELVNKIQNLRKDKDFEVTDKIRVEIAEHPYTNEATKAYNEYICGEILADSLEIVAQLSTEDTVDIDSNEIKILLSK